jgi:predicted amidohydrolase
VVFDRRGRVVHCYAKCQLTERDRQFFTPGNSIALFKLDGVLCTAIICHERRYPELVRLGVMAGARIVFHPNAGLDSLAVSRGKRGGRDGIAVRAFENAVFYVFANSVGPQGDGLWSAGDSKIVAPDSRVLALASNHAEEILVTDLDLAQATGKYAADSLAHPRFLSASWRRMVRQVRAQARQPCSLE